MQHDKWPRYMYISRPQCSVDSRSTAKISRALSYLFCCPDIPQTGEGINNGHSNNNATRALVLAVVEFASCPKLFAHLRQMGSDLSKEYSSIYQLSDI